MANTYDPNRKERWNDWYDYVNPLKYIEAADEAFTETVVDPVGDNIISPVVGWATNRDGKNAVKNAAQAQLEAARMATDENRRQFDVGQENMRPWLDYGKRNLGTMESKMGQGYFNMPNEDLEGPAFNFNMQMDPGYQYRIDQAGDAVRAAASARGNRMSGGTMGALADRTSQVASDEYGRAFGRQYGMYQDNYGRRQNAFSRKYGILNDEYNRLAGAAGIGQTQAQAMANMGQNYAANMGSMYNQMGQNETARAMGQANLQMNSPMNQFLNQLPGLGTMYLMGKK